MNFLKLPFIYFLVFCLTPLFSIGQLTNYQSSVTKCYSGPTQSFDNTTGTLIGGVSFVSGVDIPANHLVIDVIIEVVWSKSDDGSCTATTGVPTDLSHVGFQIKGPGGAPQYLATSAGTGAFALPPTVSSFSGSANIVRDTIVFKDNYPSLLPAGLPIVGRDTVAPNGSLLNAYVGQSPYGSWSVGAIDDAPSLGPQLCIHSYCVTLVTCEQNSLAAICKNNITIDVGATGVHNFAFSDLDSISDVSCFMSNLTFSPNTVSCSDIGSTIPVTMTITDLLGTSQACVSNVTIVDNTAPAITDCLDPMDPFGSLLGNLYLDGTGRDTFFASDVTVLDNCTSVVKEVRPFTGGAWGSSVPFSCVTGFQQIRFKATDAYGNSDSCIILVNVIDTIPPTAVCGQTTAYLTAAPNGDVLVPANNLDAGSFDVCPPVIGRWIGSVFAPPPVYTCADLGIDTVSLIVRDIAGNLDTCDNAVIFVVDTISPTAICKNDTVYLDALGNVTVTANNINDNSIDVCGIDSININGGFSLSFGCMDINTPQSVTLNVFDVSGNMDYCTALITVKDTFPPAANCKNITAYLNASGQAVVAASSLNDNSFDLCTWANLSFSINGNNSITYDCSAITTNPNQVTLTVADSFGNSTICTAWAIIQDTIDPVAQCATPSIYLNSSGIAVLSPSDLGGGSTDNCTVTDSFVNTIGNNFATFNCSALFTPQPATFIVQDALGNTNSCATTVNVLDSISPDALCKSLFVGQLNAIGEAIVYPINIDSNSTDNCGLVNYTINNMDSVIYTCANLGTQLALLRVEDASGNLASCWAQVLIEDNNPPVVSCQNTSVYLNSSGLATITPPDVVGTSAVDNCSLASVSFTTGSAVTYNCDSLGVRNVIIQVQDSYNNISTCNAQVTVLDTIAPIASCRPVPFVLQLDINGIGCVTPTNIDNGSADLCNLGTMLVNGVDSLCFSCADLGNNFVTLSVLDSSGNQGTCQAVVRVRDNINPVAQCKDTTVYLDASGVVNVAAAALDAGSIDNCSVSFSTLSGQNNFTFNCNNIGTNNVILVVTDSRNNTDQCSADIRVLDTIAPIADCAPLGTVNVYLDSSCFASIPASVLNNASSDNCSLAGSAFSVGGLPNVTFTAADLGTGPIILQLLVEDQSGNTASCATTVILQDTIAPVLTCNADTAQLDVTGLVMIQPSMLDITSIDNCYGNHTYTINGQSNIVFDCSNLGSNTITIMAEDSSNNMSTCIMNLEIEDLIAPVANCNAVTNLNLDIGGTTGVLSTAMVDLGSSDNCSIVQYSLSQDSFSCADITSNPHIVTLYVEDNSGNQDSCTTQVVVQDNTLPTASCQPSTVYLNSGLFTLTPADVLMTPPTGDNCTTLSSTFGNGSTSILYNCDSIGSHYVTVNVTDISGNTATCGTTIMVVDSTAPVATCNTTPYIVQLDSTGNGCVKPIDVNNGSFDFCGINRMLVNGVDSFCYNCQNVGTPTAVTLSVFDNSGNFSTCTAAVTVNDPINPVVTCHDTTLYLPSTGVITLTPAIIDAGSSDNCSFSSTINGASSINYTCAQVGTNTVQLIATDLSGNTAQCPANITLIDSVAPVANCIPPNVVAVYLDNTCFASVPASAFNGGSADNCPSTLSFTVGGLPNATFNASDIGVASITLVVRDVSGNSSTCMTSITVKDTIAPTITCQSDTFQLVSNSIAITPAMINGGSADNCGIPTLTINGQSSIVLDCGNLGMNNVTLIGTDDSGNTDSCSTTIVLEDLVAPIASCNPIVTTYLDPVSNMAVLDAQVINNNSIDNCNIIAYALSQDTFDCADISANPHTVTMYVYDESGNVDSCISFVTVEDTIAPVVNCIDTILYFSGVPLLLNAASIDSNSMDNCGIQNLALSQDTFDCPDIGTNGITLTVTDLSGNISTCIAQVTVLDTTASALAGVDQILCGVDSLILDAIELTTSGLLGTWSTATTGMTISDLNNPNATITNLPIGNHVFYWTISNNSCANLSQDSIVIDVVAESPDTAFAGLDLFLCNDTTITLSANSTLISSAQWLQDTTQMNAGVIINNPTDSMTTVSGVIPGNSYVFVWSLTNGLCGVHDEDTVVITVDEIPSDVAVAGLDVICAPDTLILGANTPLFGTGVWTTSSDSVVINDWTNPGTIASGFVEDTTLMIWTFSNGACTDYSTDTILVMLEAEKPQLMIDSFNLVSDGTLATVDVITNDSLPTNWNISIHTPMVSGLMTNEGNGTFLIDINGVTFNQYFTYEVCNADCPFVCDTAEVTIGILPLGSCYTPNAFTPNNDGSNDYFIIPCLQNTEGKAGLAIFNRWGSLVYETDNYINDWDGTHKNNPLPNGVYFYILTREGEQPQQGSIEIRR